MAEPLRHFRDHVQGKITMREITVKGVHYYAFGEAAFAASTPTALKSLTGEYYTLESIVMFWKHHTEQHANYVRDVSGRGIQAVTVLQRQALTDFLRGNIRDDAEDFDLNAPVAVPVPFSSLLAQEQRDRMEPEAKRARLIDDEKLAGPTAYEPMDVDRPAVLSDSAATIRDLCPELPAEKIAQLRDSVQKKRKQARATVPIGTDGTEMPLHCLPFEVDDLDALMKALRETEIPSCSRMGLYCRITEFESLQGYLENFKDAPPAAPQINGRTALESQNRSSQRIGYSRYDQEVFGAEPETDFQIDTNLTFHGSSLNTIRGSAVANKTGVDSLSANGDRNGHSRHSFGPRDALNPNGRPPKPKNLRPIIIIPASGTALITMYNAEDILQDLKYVPTEVKKKTKKREYELVIQRNKGNNLTTSYQVIDDPRKLKDEDWDRIVAVFVQGPAWQFKGWKYNQQPTEIFSKMCAFHLKFKEQPLDKNVEKWSVTRLELSQTQRHLDRAVLHKFWEKLDSFMVKNKSHLRF